MFNSYEELMQAVEERRQDLLTLVIPMGQVFSPEHEAAKTELAQAKAVKSIVGGGFLGDNLAELEQRVADTEPESREIWVQFKKLDLNEWAVIMKTLGGSALDQYERVLPKTFVGVFGQDPVEPDTWEGDEPWEKPEPLTTSPLAVSSKGGSKSILPGGALNSVVQNFMAWQNSGGDVTIRPTKSGLV